MAFGFARHPNLTIASGSSNSNAIELMEDAYGLGIQAPATLTSTMILVQVAMAASSGATFATLQSGGTDVTITAGKALIITPIPYKQLRIQGSSAEGADRSFTTGKVFTV